MAGSFSVILATPGDVPADALAKLFMKFHGFTAFDGQRMAKHAWGSLGEKLSAPDAARLKGLADAAGLQTVTVDEISLPDLPDAVHLRRLRLGDGGLHYTVGTDAAEKFLSEDSIIFLAAVGLREETSFVKTIHQGPTPEQRLMSAGIMMTTGIPIKIGGKGKDEKKLVRTSEFYLYLDLFTRDAKRLHVDAQKFIFTDLGDKMKPSAPANFRVLLEELSRRLPNALKNRAARMILANQPFATMGYETRADYEKECRWLLTLCRKPA